MGTADITSAYLQVDYPQDAVQIITQFEPKVAEICGLNASQKYQIKKCLYGLPDSGRQFYHFHKKNLEKKASDAVAQNHAYFKKGTMKGWRTY